MTSNITKDDITKITKDDIIEGFLEKLPGKPTKYKVRVKRQLEPIVVWESDLKKFLKPDVFAQKEKERKAREAAEAMKRVEQQTLDEDWSDLKHATLNDDVKGFDGGRKSRKKKRTRKRKRKTKRKRKKKRRKSRIKTRRKRKKRKTKKIWKSL